MARAVRARMEGDDYQALVFWNYAINLLIDDCKIEKIEFENDSVKSFDDIVIHYMEQQRFRDGYILNDFIQVKFHMTGSDVFTFENLVNPSFINATTNSFLSNVLHAMDILGDKFFESRFIIYSPIAISPIDVLYEYVSNVDGTIIIDKLFDGTTDRSKSGKIRKMLRSALVITDEKLQQVIGQIVILASRDTKEALITSLNSKFVSLGMRQIESEAGANPYIEITRTWIECGMKEFTKETFIRECQKGNLYKCYDGHNTDEFFFKYRTSIRENKNKVRTLLDRSSEVGLLGPDGIYVDTYILINGQRVLLDSIDKLLDYGRCFIVSATGGCGKSMLLRRLLIDPVVLARFIPVFVELRNVSVTHDGDSLIRAIQKEMSDNQLDISLDEIDLALRKGKILLLLDGLDEVKRDNFHIIESEIIGISNKYPNLRILASSRPYSIGSDINNKFITLEICPLELEGAKKFIKKIVRDDALADSFCTELEEGIYESHKEFADNPLLLTLMFMVYRRNMGIPDKMADFYYAAFECLYKDHDNGKGDFQRDCKTRMLGDLEFQDLLSFVCVHSYFDEDYDFCDVYLISVIKSGIKYFNLQSKIDKPEEFISDLLYYSCILILEGEEYRFIHRSFQTYFAAMFVMKNISDNKQKLMFEKMIRGDRFKAFVEFFELLRGFEGTRCLDNIFHDEFVSIYLDSGEDVRYRMLKLLFKKVGLRKFRKGTPESEIHFNMSNEDIYTYCMTCEEQENVYLLRLVMLFQQFWPKKHLLNEDEKKEFCKLLLECELDSYSQERFLMPVEKIMVQPPDIRDKVLQYCYRFYGIQDIFEYTDFIVKKEEHEKFISQNIRHYLAGIIDPFKDIK